MDQFDCRSIIESSMTRRGSSVVVEILVHPNSRREYVSVEPDGINAYVRPPPTGGKANEALLEMLKKRYGIKAAIVSGARSRRKLVEVKNCDQECLASKLCSDS
ncbi:MAG: DUF167 domain-containing protein [Desulfurococcales archaeon]|nr:DUF167 domain-containing protein [Desulfurococcales archaeon]